MSTVITTKKGSEFSANWEKELNALITEAPTKRGKTRNQRSKSWEDRSRKNAYNHDNEAYFDDEFEDAYYNSRRAS